MLETTPGSWIYAAAFDSFFNFNDKSSELQGVPCL